MRNIVGIAVACTLSGCLANGPAAPVVDTRMPVTVDYYAHRVKNPPARRPDGRVDPVDPADGRSRDFGPESRREDPSDALRADLRSFRAREPQGAQGLLALARKKKSVQTAARTEWLGEDSASTTSAMPASEPVAAPPRGVSDEGGAYRLNFVDADVADVMQAVLGKVLGLNYTIAPNVTGRITIASSAPQPRSELLSTIETVLALQGLALTHAGSTYRIAPLALGSGTIDNGGTEPGYGISVVPVQFTSVASMTKLLSGFVVEGDGIRIHAAQNAIVVRGPGPRRDEIVRAIKAFDGDWMHQQAVSMFELRRSRPEEVVAELNRIFDADTNGEAAGVIQFKPVKRLRSIMVISKNELLIRRAGAWIHRLDHQDTSAVPSIFVYRPQYRDARELTRLVNGLFGQGGSGGQQPGVSFQPGGSGTNGSSSPGGMGAGTSSFGTPGAGSGGIGMSSASYAGGLASNASLGGGAGGLGAGGANASGTRAANAGGLSGTLADPIDATDPSAANKDLHLSLTADASNNTIVAYTDGETYEKVHAVLKQLDMPPLQVAINVVVAEVQLNDDLKYGIQFYLNAHKSLGSLSLSQAATSAASSAIGSQLPGFNFLVGNAATPDVVISALDSISKVHILSTPSLVVMENKPATLEVGNQVPIVTQQAQSNLTADAPTVNSVTYLDTGIILKIVPRIGQRGIVTMDVDQEISSVVPDASGSSSPNLTPTISKRRIASAIAVQSGQNVLLAGLINDTRQQSKGQVPFLGPGLGDILGNRDNSFARNELVIFIRPVIVRTSEDAQAVTEDFRTHLNAMKLHGPPVYK